MRQVVDAAKELDIAIVSGHTGTYEGISKIVGICTAYGFLEKDRFIIPRVAKPGDCILCIKSIGLEVIINFSLIHEKQAENLFGVQRTQNLQKLVHLQSCVKEALLLAEIDGVHLINDVSEGGLIAAMNSIAEVSKVGFRIDMQTLQIPKEVTILQEVFNLSDDQVLSMSSTGTILAAINPLIKNNVERTLEKNHIEAKFIGVYTRDLSRVLISNGEVMNFPKHPYDPYEKILSKNARINSRNSPKSRDE